MNTDKTLIRLWDADEDHMISAYYTQNGADYLKQYHYCKENDLQLYIPHDLDNRDNYTDKEAGNIVDIEVGFGGVGGTMPCITVFISDIY